MKDELICPEAQQAFKEDIMRSLHCALPGEVLSFNEENQTADIQLQVKTGEVPWPALKDVPVFMPIPFEVNPGAPCLVVFVDVNIDNWILQGQPCDASGRTHSLSDAVAFVGFKTSNSP